MADCRFHSETACSHQCLQQNGAQSRKARSLTSADAIEANRADDVGPLSSSGAPFSEIRIDA
jgi:hypothetical protein